MENYQFVKQIGQGTYSEVWLVKCSKTRKKHVLKRIDLHQVSKREQRATHLEAKLLSTLKHPNIVTYLDSFHNSFGSLFIVMNYCECGDLYSFIKNQNGVLFDEKQIVHWFVQICLALKYLHDKNILHRNLKTKNIFLTKNKIIKVGDLGISKILSIAHEMTATLIETPYYTSPEIFAGKTYDEKSDIWALGCCTFEITALKHPFIAWDIHSVLQKILKQKLPSVPEMYSFELYEIISSMLDLEPKNRPCVTQLLLNDYVRRYILLILQDDSKSPDSQSSENSRELPMERSKSNSDLSLLVTKDTSSDIQRSMSTCFLTRNNKSKNSRTHNSIIKGEANTLKCTFITVPDVNGNGDGNDNSQHGRVINVKTKADHKDSKVNNGKSKNLPKTDDIRKLEKLKSNGISTGALLTPIKNSEITALANEQKMKGEISLQILNNLTYSLHTARQDNFKDNVSYSSNGHAKSSYMKFHHSITPIDTFAEKQSIKRTVKNHCNEKVTCYEKSQSNMCTLPEINTKTKNKMVAKSADHIKNLPLVKSENSKGNKLNMKYVQDKTDNVLL